MKRILMTLSLIVILSGCTQKPSTLENKENTESNIIWEYKELKIDNNSNNYSISGQKSSGNFPRSERELNTLGNEGWELSTSYTLIETAYPNFGNEGYHTGIKTNTRTKAIVYVFKRQKKQKSMEIKK